MLSCYKILAIINFLSDSFYIIPAIRYLLSDAWYLIHLTISNLFSDFCYSCNLCQTFYNLQNKSFLSLLLYVTYFLSLTIFTKHKIVRMSFEIFEVSKHEREHLARAGGVPAIGVRAVDCWQWRSGNYFHQSFLFSRFFPISPLSRPFLIEGVLGSKNLFGKSCLERPKT